MTTCGLARLPHQVAAHQIVERLVGAAQLHVRLERHRVVALHQRVHELVTPIWRPAVHPLLKFSRLSICPTVIWPVSLSTSAKVSLREPLAVAADLQLAGRGVEHLARLLEVGLGVGVDGVVVEHRPGLVAPGGVADLGRVVADDQHRLVAQVLELPHLPQHDRVAEVDVRRRRVQPQLDPQGPRPAPASPAAPPAKKPLPPPAPAAPAPVQSPATCPG